MSIVPKLLETAGAPDAVSFQDTDGERRQGSLLRLNPHQVAFEIHAPSCPLRTSEVLTEFTIAVGNRPIYSGTATLTSIVHAGAALVCEAKLEEAWVDLEGALPALDRGSLQSSFGGFLASWHKYYRILPQYKSAVADMHSFLADLRLWLDQVELAIRASPAGDRIELERDVAGQLERETTRAIGELFERFEAVAAVVEKDPAEQQAAHSAFAKRILHPLLLCSPFLYRTFRKPLGYAGDYEMVNMICRDPLEGSSLFAKLVNAWFLAQPPAQAHRNRVRWLADRLTETCAQALVQGRPARILSVGCGPAWEVQTFLAEQPRSSQAQFTLVDFNHETAEHVRQALEATKRQHQRQTTIHVVRKSVHQILKEAAKSAQSGSEAGQDLVYCAGLFDYLPDQTCRVLSNVLYGWVRPGGLFVTTNVDCSNPRRLTMDYIMDWHLIYRRGKELAALRPDRVQEDQGFVTADDTGVNIFYSLRKR